MNHTGMKTNGNAWFTKRYVGLEELETTQYHTLTTNFTTRSAFSWILNFPILHKIQAT